MRVVFAGVLQTNFRLFESVLQDLSGCVGIFCDEFPSVWQACLDDEPDLLLVDASTSSVLELVSAFRAQFADIPVVMVIGQQDRPLRQQALQAGVSDFLASPPDEIECLVRIRNLLALRQSRQELIKRTAWLADEVKEAFQAMELNAVQAQEITQIAEENLRLEQANRNKNDTLARVSHDLRAPLATILGYSELLCSDEPQVLHTRDVIARNARHLLALIDELLEFARNTIGHPPNRSESVDLQELMTHVMQQARASASGNCVSLVLSGRLPQVLVVDVIAVKRVLSNLLSNAVKYTRNGTVTLGVSAKGDDPGRQTLLFEVTDSGEGIAPDDLVHIFEPFYRATRMPVPGSGLGLAICRQLAEAMGGRISVESVPGRGSCFSFQLTCPVDYRTLDVEAVHAVDIVGGGRQLLLVEDDEAVRHYLRERLDRAGFEVIAVESGRAALDVMAQSLKLPVAVITDQAMPEMDGWALLSALRAQYGDTLPVILLSSDSPNPPAHWPEWMRFDATLLKSADSMALLNVLARLLKDAACVARAGVHSFAKGRAAPDEPVLDKMQHLAELGLLSLLEAEATMLAENFPEHADFAGFVLARCAVLDVEGVATYCAKHRESMAVG